MEERNKMLFAIAVTLTALGIAISVIIYFVIRGSMEEDKGTDFYWKSPSLVFSDGTEMSGAAVVEGIMSFKGYAVRFTVVTLDGTSKDYNFDGKNHLPSYDNGLATTEPGYINPSGRFMIKGIADEDGKVTHVVITQS